MRFIDQLYEMYRGHFNGAEEDIVAIVVGTLQEQSREDLYRLIKELDDEELFHMVALSFVEMMKRKAAMEDERPPAITHELADTPLRIL